VHSPDNRAAWHRADVVVTLGALRGLQPPEQAVMDKLGAWLEGKRMLDVAVGAGRTTPYFAPIVGSYLGTDFSAPVLQGARSSVGDEFGNVSLAVEDMRDLSRYEPGSFDFVLCSFNGLDCISHEERLIVLTEFRRVCEASGAICFSSHNLGSLPDLFRVGDARQPGLVDKVRRLARCAMLRTVNESPRRLMARPYAMVRDGALNFELNQYYVAPHEQLAQLKAAGFPSVDVYGQDGRLVVNGALDHATDGWLYYLARS
jgi:SAM-dependent methyltransferase